MVGAWAETGPAPAKLSLHSCTVNDYDVMYTTCQKNSLGQFTRSRVCSFFPLSFNIFLLFLTKYPGTLFIVYLFWGGSESGFYLHSSSIYIYIYSKSSF